MPDNRPASVPEWASDATFTSGPKAGSPTKVQPSSGAEHQGDVPGQPYRSERHNWLWALLSAWAFYLSDLPNQTQFLNKAFAWIGNHTFATRPQLATPTVRSSRLRVMDAVSLKSGGATFDTNNRPSFDNTGTAQVYLLTFKVPVGGTLNGISIVVQNGSPANVTVDLWKTSGTSSTDVQLGTATTYGGTGALSITAPTNFTADVPTDLTYYWMIVRSDDSSNTATWNRATVQWTDPGFLSSIGG